MSIPVGYTNEGCKIVIVPVRRRPLTWGLRVQCPKPVVTRTGRKAIRWVWIKTTELYVCSLLHFAYCRRKDRTRNIVIDSTDCVNIIDITCVGSVTKCREEILNRIMARADIAKMKAEECYDICFGGNIPKGEIEEGIYYSLERINYCCYHRCDNRWRCCYQANNTCICQPEVPPLAW